MRQGRHAVLAAVAALSAGLCGCGRFAGPLAHYADLSESVSGWAPAERADPGQGACAPAGAPDQFASFLADGDKPIGAEAGQAQPATRPAGPVHWSQRRGPAYEKDWVLSFGRDAKEFAPILWDDTKATFTDPWALVGLGLAGASGIVLNASGSDNRVQDHYDRRGSQLNTFWDSVGDAGGNPGTHFALAGGMYFASLWREDLKGYETSKALLSALSINGLTTVALKGIVRTRSPNGDPFGWPSGHTSSSFCFATVMHEAYGPLVGVPLFAFASYVGYERLDARNHDFSDVISGALIGVAIGHAVMQNHRPRIFGFDVLPWADPADNSIGLALVKRF